ncbi:hypothetical protein ACF1G0_22400 [Streptomyces sp. NPDC013953]|uniref:hypothetical protein n=1 Tax=Streptomyces sp. NPDC013953 TaxID=3364868 RepID=UPI003702C88A
MAEYGMLSGAQALAANVWGTLIRGLTVAYPGWWLMPNGQWPGYAKGPGEHPGRGGRRPPIRQFCEAAVVLLFPRRLELFWPSTPVTVP